MQIQNEEKQADSADIEDSNPKNTEPSQCEFEPVDSDHEDIEDNKDNNSPNIKLSKYQYELNAKDKIRNLIYTEEEYNMIQQFIEFANDDTKYQWESTATDITDFKMEYIASANATDGMCIARGTTIIECNPEDLFFGYDDYNKIKDLDENCVCVELMHKYDDHRRIMSSSFKAPSPAWYREFVFKEIRSLIDDEGHVLRKEEDEEEEQIIDFHNSFVHMKGRGSVCLGYSIPSEECPFEDTVRNKHVRCDLKFGGYHFESIGVDQCRATYLVCMDLKGWIPVWFQNMLLPQQSKNILTMKNYIESCLNKLKNTDMDDIKQ